MLSTHAFNNYFIALQEAINLEFLNLFCFLFFLKGLELRMGREYGVEEGIFKS